MSESIKTAIVIPTRNRAELAQSAIRSVLGQESRSFALLVSDNSTIEMEKERLRRFCKDVGDPRLSYISPPAPLPMTDHWEWAMNQVLRIPGVSHVSYLTDRMIFKKNGLSELLEIVKGYPNTVISYSHDRIEDYIKPVLLEQITWSGSLFELSSPEVLAAFADLEWNVCMCLPRMLNSVVPRNVFHELIEKYGNIFLSIAPDFCFAFRCLDTVASIIYYDKPILLHYAQDRSNGASQARGVVSKDNADFVKNLGGTKLNYAAPVPEFNTVMNVVVHEYCATQQQTRSPRFPLVNWANYLELMSFEIFMMDNSDIKREMEALLKRYSAIPKNLGAPGRDPRFDLSSLVSKFDTSTEAIDYCHSHPRPRSWAASPVEVYLDAKLRSARLDLVVLARFIWLKVMRGIAGVRRKVRRFLDVHILWRFHRSMGQ